MAIQLLYSVQSFSLEKLYFRLNDICGVLQLYDPAQGLQHSACFFLVTKTIQLLYNVQSPLAWKNCTLDQMIFVEFYRFMILPKACNIVPVFFL